MFTATENGERGNGGAAQVRAYRTATAIMFDGQGEQRTEGRTTGPRLQEGERQRRTAQANRAQTGFA